MPTDPSGRYSIDEWDGIASALADGVPEGVINGPLSLTGESPLRFDTGNEYIYSHDGKPKLYIYSGGVRMLNLDASGGYEDIRAKRPILLDGPTPQIGRLTAAETVPTDVRNLSSPSQGWIAYHDGSGSNTEGLAQYTSAGSWQSIVDGTTIS